MTELERAAIEYVQARRAFEIAIYQGRKEERPKLNQAWAALLRLVPEDTQLFVPESADEC